MPTSRNLLPLLVLLFAVSQAATAQNGDAASANGKIVEQSAYALPTYDQIPDRFKRAYPRDAVEKIRSSPDLELLKIKYMSDGLKVVGFIYKPKVTGGKKLPAVIFNRGGLAGGAIGRDNFNYLWEMHRYAAEGFVVLASQYRGTDGGEGKDEAAGADTNDVMNLIPLAKSLDYVDMNRLFMWGYSRGAMMTLQAVKRGAPIKAAAIVGAPTNLLAFADDPGFLQFASRTYPDFDARKEEHLKNRSAVHWADKLDVPLLIMHGGADPGTPPSQALALAQKLEQTGKLYELIIYARDDHGVTANAEDRLRRTVDWFKNVRKRSIAQAIRPTLEELGVEAAIKQYHDLKRNHADTYDFAERELNQLGYELMNRGQILNAIEIFKLNVAMYPQAFNTYDSLGEAYLASGNRGLAVKNYQKSLELNPQNTNATDVLKKLNEKQP